MHSNNSPKFSIEFKNNQFISKSEYKREQMLWLGNISHLHPNQAAESQNSEKTCPINGLTPAKEKADTGSTLLAKPATGSFICF